MRQELVDEQLRRCRQHRRAWTRTSARRLDYTPGMSTLERHVGGKWGLYELLRPRASPGARRRDRVSRLARRTGSARALLDTDPVWQELRSIAASAADTSEVKLHLSNLGAV
jgi:hypothetical protein